MGPVPGLLDPWRQRPAAGTIHLVRPLTGKPVIRSPGFTVKACG